ncbi:hemolytic lectin [Daedaleopsis nitida]|nr:hemolytic lectin [Daedaleopsis nitida]
MSSIVKVSSKGSTAVAGEVYIPPAGLAFRILGHDSQNVIFSRLDANPQVGQVSVTDKVNDNQYFTLLYGTGARTGTYAIKGRVSGDVLYSRTAPEPRVYHNAGDGQDDDNWFKFEAGTGPHAKSFRLITPSQSVAVYSRTDQPPFLANIDQTQLSGDQFFTFIWEDMQVDKVEYNLDAGTIVSSNPIILSEETFTNNTNAPTEVSFVVDQAVKTTSEFEYSTGFPVTFGMAFSVGIPLYNSGSSKFTVGGASANEWGWSTQSTMQVTGTFPIALIPHQAARAVSVVNQGILSVPYTLYLSSKSSGVQVQTTGTWHGVSAWYLLHTVTFTSLTN